MAESKGQPFVCHGEPEKGKPCTTELARGSAWTPALTTLRKVVSRWPNVADLANHTFCGSCAALGRKAGLRFYLHDDTVTELERRRVERSLAARQAFARYCR